MPHLVIEYAEEIIQHSSPQEIMQAAYAGAVKSELFNPSDIKARARSYQNYISGAEHDAFINVTTHILSGRTKEQKKHLSESILNELINLGLANITLTVQTYDIDRDIYAKVIL